MSNSEIIGRIFSEAISCLHGGTDGGRDPASVSTGAASPPPKPDGDEDNGAAGLAGAAGMSRRPAAAAEDEANSRSFQLTWKTEATGADSSSGLWVAA